MNFRTTRIYRRSLELVELVAELMERLPTGYGFLADQMRRAAASVTLNYIEGCGRTGAADRRRFFIVATGSVLEVAGVLDVMARFRIIDGERLTRGHDLCDHLAAMLRRFH